jgi:hypothetical protein
MVFVVLGTIMIRLVGRLVGIQRVRQGETERDRQTNRDCFSLSRLNERRDRYV